LRETISKFMARTSTARRLDEIAPARPAIRLEFGGGDPPAPPVRPNAPIASNARVATVMFLAAEAMFFAGLIGAFIVFRIGSAVWPPPFQPRLPVAITGVNTVILLLSAVTMHIALRCVRLGAIRRASRLIAMTAAMGGVFLLIQGWEWARLIHFGLTVSSSIYGGLFYTLIGFHAFHVAGALVWLIVVFVQANRGRFSRQRNTGLQVCAMYWTFVVLLWPILYGLVYLY
jgi:heme/copper-type cytochrome/quinol oxidase subunit 3